MQTQRQHLSALFLACWKTHWEQSGDCLWLLEPDGRVLDGNPGAARLAAGAAFIGMPFGQLSCWREGRLPENFQADLQQALRGAAKELDVALGQGRLQLSLWPITDETGAVALLLVSGRAPAAPSSVGGEALCLPPRGVLQASPNRGSLLESLALGMARAHREEFQLAVCQLTINDFRAFKDSLGDAVGDQLLLTAAQRLQHVLRGGDTVASQGEGEFVLLIGDLNRLSELDWVMERVQDILAQPFEIGGHCIQLSAVLGVTMYPEDSSDGPALLDHAAQALAAVRQEGSAAYGLFDAEDSWQPRRQTSARLREALATHEFELHYQPKVSLRSGRVVGVEALLRWRHPERGLLLPGEFMAAIDEAELSIEVGKWVIETALAQTDEWRQAGIDLAVSVNVSSQQLQDDHFVSHLTGALTTFPQLPDGALELEIVESAALHDIQRVGEIIIQCHQLGVNFALDDFGTGYSSLTYLKGLPARTVKIDQSFIVDLLRNPEDVVIVESIVSLSQALHWQVVAEGVETRELGAMVLSLGCEIVQGFGIARPMHGQQMPDWVRGYRPDLTGWMEDSGAMVWA